MSPILGDATASEKQNLFAMNPMDRSGPNSFTWTDGTPCLYTDWSKGQPDNAHGKEFCTEIFNHDKKWNDQPCHHYSSNDYLCQKPTNCK